MASGPADSTASLDNISIVLVEPQHTGNIGATARAMKNMGLKRLVLVRPHPPLDEQSIQMARGADDILRESLDVSTIDEALAGIAITVATTARTGRRRRDALSPRDASAILAPLTLANKTAILFGPERTGLPNDIVERCQWVVCIPTQAHFHSLNLAQAVLILGYEMMLAAFPRPRRSRTLATQEQLDGLYGHLRDILLKIGFLDPVNPERMILALTRMLARTGLDQREVNIIRGILRQIDWYRRNAAPIGEPHRPPLPSHSPDHAAD